MSVESVTPGDVVQFWRAAGPKRWFARDAVFDREFGERFSASHFAAARRELDAWQDTPEGLLALILLTDQFPRNAFRGSGHMYATDPLARYYARQAQARGCVAQVEEPLRLFFLLPFAHSEDLADQDLSVALHEALGPEWTRHALEHREIIRRFGRFPHRNSMLGRVCSTQEQEFLDQGGFSG